MPDSRFQSLLSRLTEGLLSPSEAEELEEILLHDRAAREEYRIYLAVHAELEHGEVLGSLAARPVVRHSWWRPALAAAAAVVIGLLIWRPWVNPQVPTPVTDQESPPEPSVMAIITSAEGVQWDRKEPVTPGTGLVPGVIRLSGGDLTLSLLGGADVTVRSPAEFELQSDAEFRLVSGRAAFRSREAHRPYVIHLEHGSVVDSGSEFSIVADKGNDLVRVFTGKITVTGAAEPGNTVDELELAPGSTLLVNQTIRESPEPESFFPRVPASLLPGSALHSGAYAVEVRKSQPVAYWRFEESDAMGVVKDETGEHPLELAGRARIEGKSGGYLFVNERGAAGFAFTPSGIQGLDTARGRSVECMLYATAEKNAVAVALEQDGLLPENSNHAPQGFLLESTGKTGTDVRYRHPNFALRTLWRSPVGYAGGYNLYSTQSHLLYRWVHVVATFGPEGAALYIDGELSRRIPTALQGRNTGLRATIGRLQPGSVDERRQWSGGIDEVALYDRPLSAAEVKAHFEATRR